MPDLPESPSQGRHSVQGDGDDSTLVKRDLKVVGRNRLASLVRDIMTVVSQWEREAIGERTRDAMNHKRANGERVGTVPFGWRLAPDGIHLEENPSEQQALSNMRDLRAAGHTLRAIADELNRQGCLTRRGTAWRFQYVAEALRAA
jgi:DNA invertase Pin-like site-specific DNA recombinase